MKLLHGGYTPRVAGRPSSEISSQHALHQLKISLIRAHNVYAPVVKNGQKVNIGDIIASSETPGGLLHLPSPAAGEIKLGNSDENRINIEPQADQTADKIFDPKEPQYITQAEITETLTKSGIWPFFWSSNSGAAPSTSGEERPKAIIVNCVISEPYRARGRVILANYWDDVIEGIRYLPRLLDEYGKVEVILTQVNDPVARRMYDELSGDAWTRIHSVPVIYPVEHPVVLMDSMRKARVGYQSGDLVWEIDVQGVAELGKCLSSGKTLSHRLVAIGGPGCKDPKHVLARVGTGVSELLGGDFDSGHTSVLRGGLLTGEPIDPEHASIQYDDDAFFCLPNFEKREFVTFLRPGFNRTSYFPAFATGLTRGRDRHITNALRGELRPCIACGACEKACPVQLLPQVLHRYLFRGLLDEAANCGLDRCIDCNLCTFVCPSKIELGQQFAEAREQLQAERNGSVTPVSEITN